MARAAGALVAVLVAAAAALATAQQVVTRPKTPLEQLVALLTDPAAPLPWRAQMQSTWVWLTSLPSPPSLHARAPLPSLPGVSDECNDGLRALADAFERRELWALRMVDASTKIPDGLLAGNFVHLGNFDECLSARRGRAGGPADFDGRHCLVTFTAKLRPDDPLWEAAEREEAGAKLQLLSVAGMQANGIIEVPIRIAWCAPSSCSPRDLQTAAQAIVNDTGMAGSVSVRVDPAQCHTHEGKQLRGIDIFAICMLGVFVVLAVASTAFDVLTRSRARRHPLPLAFSLYSNWPKLIAVTSGGNQLTCLNGIRVISIVWIVVAHVYLVNAFSPAINAIDYMEKFVRAPERLVVMNGSIVVDTFFLMSGLLLVFLFLQEVRRTNRFHVLKFYVHRYVRLTPALAIVMLLSVTVVNYAGTGPMWDSRHNRERDVCEKNWWTNILYVNNYVDPHNMCLGHTWYLAVDMQLYWLSPLVLVPLWKLPKKPALLWVCFLLLVGWAVPFTVVYLKEIRAGAFVGSAERQMAAMQYYYWPMHTRSVPWLLGALLGYALLEARAKKPEIPPWAVALGWILSAVFMLGALFGAYPFQQPDYVYNRVEAAFWLSLFRGVWALGVGWVIFACDQGYGGIVDKILSWSTFQPLGRFCYCVYLTHIAILYVYSGGLQTSIHLSDVHSISQACGTLFMSVAISIPLILVFESPIISIEKILFHGDKVAVQNNDRICCVQRNRSKEWRVEHGKRW